MTKIIKTAEFVTPLHPDKICDFIADSILDAYLEKDKNSRVAVEVMGGHKLITINGEITSNAKVEVAEVVKRIVGDDYKIIVNLVEQSREIGRGVDTGGAGDQGIMCGYATNETEELLPLEYVLARSLCKYLFEKYPYDGKTQITIADNKITTVVASFQNSKNEDLSREIKKWYEENYAQKLGEGSFEILSNQAGEWTQGGFDADTGLSGRKLIIDNYGPEKSIGGGSFSGKDYTKVDRSGAYIARKIAVDILKKRNLQEVSVRLAYAIGKNDPVMCVAIIDDKYEEIVGYDLSPSGIKKLLNLENQKYTETCKWGHFGNNFEWDK